MRIFERLGQASFLVDEKDQNVYRSLL